MRGEGRVVECQVSRDESVEGQMKKDMNDELSGA